ncbi:AbrB/MazE/SpoVT family DNA-binding domain-containing protein [Gemmatimonadota bacterium]
MMKQVKLRRAGGSVSATLPKEMADRLRLQSGDEVYVIETDKGLLITPYDPAFERALAVYDRGSKKYRNALRELADGEPEE